ncbi:hypothetical protein PTTG_08820 [Puccinia triticina 1-1 BBBD Race 1]|uniref:HAT C-terminal dimerisation domain-containing protein n=1 Tax=Puccinia triticina (isolate 1-1 / race 1 (BBBD)) TaxID=630390 RepID=A0A180G8J1_PUCT1|nr:hypothetical protein PTTG_08820 [Puccinia triticina 1-1 BBBD Race 1]
MCDCIFRFHEEEDNSSSTDDKEELPADISERSNGELAEDDELTLADLKYVEDEKDDDVYTSESCCRSLAKFRAIATKLKKSPNSKSRFIQLCRETQCQKPHNVERDVPTRWNSTYLQLLSIFRCENTIVTWQRDKQFGTPRNLHVNQEDLDLAADLVQILKPFYKMTLQLLMKALARVAEVVVMIDQITATLSAVIANKDGKYPAALRNACCFGLQITNKYYSLTDCAPIYRIAMVLHPSFKDEYFKLAKWPKSWISEAIDLTCKMYNTWYKPSNTITAPKPPRKGPIKPQTGVLARLGAAAVARSSKALSDPVDIWLSGGLYLEDGKPINGLEWCAEQKRSGNNHHGLLQMALDVMCCPATTVDVKHTFSFGRDVVLAKRHKLNAKLVGRGMVLSFYSKNDKIEPLALHKHMEKMKDKSKGRMKARGATEVNVVTVD